ncbi:hypothetical protein A1O3_03865 [Capronia epimyces CBS 606.96]|uniref:SMP-30/Gluconolactonase/LRE-like region domain-containing protein n=1 Tax=Capronia epimyces CBS 606.96 TaxID=1182542 RepID=W9YCF3_9EURO|nr:uncharacterized protein A1O3_03865 [Capronia epimyces CBS 606.96]EXJ86911.1 hypothetical protein A1O3_03865 [Capronia epimyces CBS 606.96]
MVGSVKTLVAPHTKLGESPIVRQSDGTLHFIDVLGAAIHVLKLPDLQVLRSITCPQPISFICFHEEGGYVACSFDSVVRIGEDGGWQVMKQVLADSNSVRLNDGAVDSQGRLWFGSIDLATEAVPISDFDSRIHSPRGSLYRYDRDGTLTVFEDGGIVCGNGIGWSPDEATMYFTDSYIGVIWAYDFEPGSGSIRNKRILIDRRGLVGQPDGLLVDSEGSIYTFLWDGAAVVKYDSTGRELARWPVNSARVTHGAWFGDQYNHLFITSAESDDGSAVWKGEEAGALFELRDMEAAGLEKHVFKGKATIS